MLPPFCDSFFFSSSSSLLPFPVRLLSSWPSFVFCFSSRLVLLLRSVLRLLLLDLSFCSFLFSGGVLLCFWLSPAPGGLVPSSTVEDLLVSVCGVSAVGKHGEHSQSEMGGLRPGEQEGRGEIPREGRWDERGKGTSRERKDLEGGGKERGLPRREGSPRMTERSKEPLLQEGPKGRGGPTNQVQCLIHPWAQGLRCLLLPLAQSPRPLSLRDPSLGPPGFPARCASGSSPAARAAQSPRSSNSSSNSGRGASMADGALTAGSARRCRFRAQISREGGRGREWAETELDGRVFKPLGVASVSGAWLDTHREWFTKGRGYERDRANGAGFVPTGGEA